MGKKKTDSWSEAENVQDFHPVVSESKEAVVGAMGQSKDIGLAIQVANGLLENSRLELDSCF